MKVALSAQKALQGSDTDTKELLEGKKEDCIFPDEGSLIFTDTKIESMARPAQPQQQQMSTVAVGGTSRRAATKKTPSRRNAANRPATGRIRGKGKKVRPMEQFYHQSDPSQALVAFTAFISRAKDFRKKYVSCIFDASRSKYLCIPKAPPHICKIFSFTAFFSAKWF